jgi:multicomponent Na+:H+ antiporter subunit F
MIWLVAVVVLGITGILPGIYRVGTGSDLHRLVGLQVVSVVGVMMVIALSVAVDQSSYLIVAVVLSVLSATGILVFTRLLHSRASDEPSDRPMPSREE